LYLIAMRIVLQRVRQASVSIVDRQIAKIGMGLVLLVGVSPSDQQEQARYLAEKIANLRIFEDDAGKMNRSLLDVGGEAIVVSQFTLFADTRKGRRPSFTGAAQPHIAEPLVEQFAEMLAQLGVPTQGGQFGAHMLVEIVNDGPVTIILER
jgi:D-tyrosyl-tRNA(Tyr) deacylase